MSAPKDTRAACPYCSVRTWRTDWTAFMRDHDRPDGRRCVAASNYDGISEYYAEKERERYRLGAEIDAEKAKPNPDRALLKRLQEELELAYYVGD